MNWLSNLKDFLVKDNFGLHLTLAFMVFTLISLWSVTYSFILVGSGIVLMEVYDKYYLKTKFSIKDIVAGIIGMVLAFLVYYYGR